MTSTSGPGISLMSKFTGLAYFVEIPAVIWDIQRIGPSTGLPTRTSQGDILTAKPAPEILEAIAQQPQSVEGLKRLTD